MGIGGVILSPVPPTPTTNGEQLELLAPDHLLEAALKPFLFSTVQPVVLVLGHDYHRILNKLKNLPSKVKVVIDRKPQRGLSSALKVGLSALGPELDGIVIAKGDQVVESRVLERLLRTFESEARTAERTKRIVVPLYHGKRGFPWIVASELRKSLARLEGDFTFNSFLKENRKEIVAVSVDEG